ncbi:ABC transporter permease [Citreimonas sp.]|uniref:ABC transporter permease n=1 Tax=Citreimonas sp. TaxID=3036715 RepID=UPI0035C7EBA6
MPNLSDIDTLRNRVLSVLLLVLILGTWELFVRSGGVPVFVQPPPTAIAEALWRGFATGVYWEHIAVTLFEVLAGYAIGCGLGFLLGIGIALNRYVAYFAYPYIIMFLSMPKVALVPLIVLWFGLGMTSKIVTAALISFFPLMVNTITGLNAADKNSIDLMRSLGASKRQIFVMLRLPSALPFIFAGLEIAITLALIGTVVAEFLGAERGLGMLMQNMNFLMDIGGSFSILIILALLGLLLNRTLLFVRRRLYFWERFEDGSKNAKPSPAAETT